MDARQLCQIVQIFTILPLEGILDFQQKPHEQVTGMAFGSSVTSPASLSEFSAAARGTNWSDFHQGC